MKTLFENQTLTSAQPPEVHDFLTHPENIFRWAYDVDSVRDLGNGAFRLFRPEETFNGTESLSVKFDENSVSYNVSGELLSYQIVFELTELSDGTRILEKVSTSDETDWRLPLKFAKPVIQREFKRNLSNLTALLNQ